jgi:hypothetical protein
MMRASALAYNSNARPAGQEGRAVGGTTHGKSGNIRMVAGVSEFAEMPLEPASCSGKTKAGKDCKAHPVKGTQLCAGHTQQFEKFLNEAE